MDASNKSIDLCRAVFVIIGRNEGERLRACLQSVLATTDRVVYADSCSTDGSPQLAQSMGARVVAVTSAPLNAARGRNEGLRAALEHFPDSVFVQFLDGDCILQPGWPQASIAFLDQNPTAAVACGRRYEAFPGTSVYNQFADAEWDTAVGRAQACGGDAMMRIKSVLAVGGFDSELMAGEEPELCARLRSKGWEIWRLGELMTEHDAAILHFSQWWRRTLRSGFGYAQVWQRTRSTSQPLYARQLQSAFFWALLFPLAIIAGAIFANRAAILLLIPIGYCVQFARIMNRRTGALSFRFASSALLMLAKFAEVSGALRYILTKSYSRSIEYKHASR